MAIDLVDYLKKEKFQQWLEAQPEGSFVGERGEQYACPIANYLTNVLPGVEVCVRGFEIEGCYRTNVDDDYEDLELQVMDNPETTWVQCFVDYVDEKPPELEKINLARDMNDDEYNHWTQATREEALGILEKC